MHDPKTPGQENTLQQEDPVASRGVEEPLHAAPVVPDEPDLLPLRKTVCKPRGRNLLEKGKYHVNARRGEGEEEQGLVLLRLV